MSAAIALIAAAGRHGGRIMVQEGNLLLSAPAPLPADLLAEIRQHKAELILTLASPDDFDERAAIAQFDAGIPAEWVEGFAKLQTIPAPGDMPSKRWEQVINDAGLFLDRWAMQATSLGWGTLDVFGIHEAKPYKAIHCSGLVALIGGDTVTAITADTCSIRHANGVINRYYRRPAQPGQIPLWGAAP